MLGTAETPARQRKTKNRRDKESRTVPELYNWSRGPEGLNALREITLGSL